LLSFGAVYAYIPVIVIVILIAAAAGLSRGTDIFAIFGVGALIGVGNAGRRGLGSALKYRNDAQSRGRAAGRLKGYYGGKIGKKVTAVKKSRAAAKEAALLAKSQVSPAIASVKPGGAAGAAAAAAGKGVQFPKNYLVPSDILEEEGKKDAVAAGIAAAAAKAAAEKRKGWATRTEAPEYLISSDKTPGKKWRSKMVMAPASADTDMLAFKANPKNLQENIKNAGGKTEAKMYAAEQKAAWGELLHRGKSDKEARDAVMNLTSTFGLKHPGKTPSGSSSNAYEASGKRDKYAGNVRDMLEAYKGAGWSPSRRKAINDITEGKVGLIIDAPKLKPGATTKNIDVSGLKDEMKKNSWKEFKNSSKEAEKKAGTDISLTGSGWEDYFKNTHPGKGKRARTASPSNSKGGKNP